MVDAAVAAVVDPLLLEKGRSDCGCTSPRCCWRTVPWWYGKDHIPCHGVFGPWMILRVNRRSLNRVIHATVLVRSRRLLLMIVCRSVAGIRMNAMSPVAGACDV